MSPGYGVYINSSVGGVLLSGSTVSENGADGVRYVHHDQQYFQRDDLYDFCTFPTTYSHSIYPVKIAMAQSLYSPIKKECSKVNKMMRITRLEQIKI